MRDENDPLWWSCRQALVADPPLNLALVLGRARRARVHVEASDLGVAAVGDVDRFDVKYTMDELDRLIDAEEGTRSSGSIASRTRHQTWTTLDHVGNWDRSKLDLDGDDNWNETDEYDDTRTNNKVNELLTRDTDSNASVNYTLAYDAAGNLTDDAESYEYVYDAFYRRIDLPARCPSSPAPL